MDTVTRQVLIDARALIADPDHWTQGAWARNAQGERLDTPYSADAVCWCLAGAINYVAGKDATQMVDTALSAVAPGRGGTWVFDMNDTHTHAEVLALFDRALAS